MKIVFIEKKLGNQFESRGNGFDFEEKYLPRVSKMMMKNISS